MPTTDMNADSVRWVAKSTGQICDVVGLPLWQMVPIIEPSQNDGSGTP